MWIKRMINGECYMVGVISHKKDPKVIDKMFQRLVTCYKQGTIKKGSDASIHSESQSLYECIPSIRAQEILRKIWSDFDSCCCCPGTTKWARFETHIDPNEVENCIYEEVYNLCGMSPKEALANLEKKPHKFVMTKTRVASSHKRDWWELYMANND